MNLRKMHLDDLLLSPIGITWWIICYPVWWIGGFVVCFILRTTASLFDIFLIVLGAWLGRKKRSITTFHLSSLSSI